MVAGIAAAYLIVSWRLKARLEGKEARIRSEVEERVRSEARGELEKKREELESRLRETRSELGGRERRIEKREDAIDRKLDLLDKKDAAVERIERQASGAKREAEKKLREAEEFLSKREEELSRVAGLTRAEARKEFLERAEKDAKQEASDILRRHATRAREEAAERSREIVLDSMQSMASDFAAETVVSTVDIPSDEMKGRIIGREGRNIRAFEKATGVDVIVDDTPGVVVVSGFDGVRREVARLAMEKLVRDGRIHPARIEEVVAKTAREMEKRIKETGKRVAQEFRVGNLRPKEIELMGRLRYRTSYGQNCLDHSREVALIAGRLASELKLDSQLARRAGLLHDMGKAVDHEVEGTHPSIGAEIARSCDEREEVVNAVGAHHDDVPATNLYTAIVQVADAISAARPGARRDSLEKYIERLRSLEEIANRFPGVEKAFAIQAGREVRVIAKADELTEVDCARICKEIAQHVEEELSYPGEVKVTMVRESRFIEYAR